MRWDTTVSRAVRKALGLPMPTLGDGSRRVGGRPTHAKRDLMECFANESSPMDRL